MLQLSVDDAVMRRRHNNRCMIDQIDSKLQDSGAVRKREQIQSENGVVGSCEGGNRLSECQRYREKRFRGA